MLERIDIEKVIEVACRAGEAIMEIYRQDFSVEFKSDDSPLTKADRRAHEIIAEGLSRILYDIDLPLLSEEGAEIPWDARREWEYFWMVDPLDGTKEFVKKNDEFTVNIALIHRHAPVLGVVYAPATGELYYAKQGQGAYKAASVFQCSDLPKALRSPRALPLSRTRKNDKELIVVASRSHMNEETQTYIDALRKEGYKITLVSRGSSLKICMVAEGSADIYPRLAPTMEWDTAAADAVARETGKAIYRFPIHRNVIESTFLQYNKPNLYNPYFIIS